ncbi:hypothetical protein ACFZDG_15375 [Kitasatospora xanthocidica]|uniref:hypothetical protein n=1 Tax=Kitasatospora xanthocidica TaxID=83382 RepID=UPI0036F0D0AE
MRERLVLAAAAWLPVLALLLPAGAPLRIAVIIGVGLVLPGFPIVRRLPPEHRAADRAPAARRLRLGVLSVAVSLGCATIVAESLLLTHHLTPGLALVVLAGLGTVAALAPGGAGRGRGKDWRRADGRRLTDDR